MVSQRSALFLSCFLFGWSALAPAPARADECDVSGHYVIDIEWGSKPRCLSPNAQKTELLIVKEGGGFAVRNTHGARFAVTSRAEAGVCQMGLVETVDHYTVGGGPADFVRFNLDLSVAGARVTGRGSYDELGPDGGAAEPKCTDHVGVTGLRVPMAAADLRFDEAAARRDLVEALASVASGCDIPYFDRPHKGKAVVELTVAALGGVNAIKLDGVDQNLKTTCDGIERTLLNGFQNPSGQARSLRFAVDMSTIHPRPKPKDLVVLPADRQPISIEEKDCMKSLQELTQGDADSLRTEARGLCDLRVKHQAARDRLLKALSRIVTEYREQTNHDHSKNLPTTIKALQDLVKDCLAAVESQEWCHNIGCAIEPEENATFCETKAAEVAERIVAPD